MREKARWYWLVYVNSFLMEKPFPSTDDLQAKKTEIKEITGISGVIQ
jgi:hypothetical protein